MVRNSDGITRKLSIAIPNELSNTNTCVCKYSCMYACTDIYVGLYVHTHACICNYECV